MTPARRRLLVGAGLATISGLCFSSGGFFVRSVSVDPWEIIAVRCFFAGLGVLLILFVTERGRVWPVLRASGWPVIAVGVATAWGIIAYVLSMQYTLVANVIAIMTTSTVMVALLAKPVLGEPVAPRTWLALLGSLCGVGVMFWSDVGGGGVIGNLLALSIAAAIALQTLIARRFRTGRMEPAVLLAAVIAGLASLPLALPFDATAREVGFMAALGLVQLASALTPLLLRRTLPARPDPHLRRADRCSLCADLGLARLRRGAGHAGLHRRRGDSGLGSRQRPLRGVRASPRPAGRDVGRFRLRRKRPRTLSLTAAGLSRARQGRTRSKPLPRR